MNPGFSIQIVFFFFFFFLSKDEGPGKVNTESLFTSLLVYICG